MNTIEKKCKEKGVRLTDQRKLLLKLCLSQKKNMEQKIIQM